MGGNGENEITDKLSETARHTCKDERKEMVEDDENLFGCVLTSGDKVYDLGYLQNDQEELFSLKYRHFLVLQTLWLKHIPV